MLEPILRCSTGQLLSFLLALSSIFLESACNDSTKVKVPFFFLISMAYTVILVGSVLYILIFGAEKRKRVPFWLLAISGLFDFLGGYFISYAFVKLPLYIAVLILQMIYPMTVIVDLVVFKNRNINYKNIAVFVVLTLLCFYVNMEISAMNNASVNRTAMDYICGVSCAFVCNIFYMTNTILQGRVILPAIDASWFLVEFSLYGILFGFMITFTRQFETFSFKYIKDIYTQHYLIIVVYGAVLGVFYVAASPYINKFGPNAFNGSIITQSAYLGLNLLRESYSSDPDAFFIAKKMCMFAAICFCILSSVLLVFLEKRGVAKEEDAIVNDSPVK